MCLSASTVSVYPLKVCLSFCLSIYCMYLCILRASIHISVYLPYHIYQEGALSLRAVSMQSAGQYTCHASNSEGNVTRVTKVKIKGQLIPDGLSVCLSVYLPASSFSLCEVCVPDWLGATVIYISVSPSCIIWQSGNRKSNWIQLLFCPCEDNVDIMIWDKISSGILGALLYRDKTVFAHFKGDVTLFWTC